MKKIRGVKLHVYGRVQGVNFRNNVKRFCDDGNIKGRVMNKEDGSVLIIAQANREKLEELEKWIKSSPGFSRIDEVRIEEKGINKYCDFRIVREELYWKDKEKAFINLIRKL
ncbi:acylphosphatase [Candidatus Pacearchaeota archaeon]|nr:acylphosphatase [Candidatus Pacearchaeota archaeon]